MGGSGEDKDQEAENDQTGQHRRRRIRKAEREATTSKASSRPVFQGSIAKAKEVQQQPRGRASPEPRPITAFSGLSKGSGRSSSPRPTTVFGGGAADVEQEDLRPEKRLHRDPAHRMPPPWKEQRWTDEEEDADMREQVNASFVDHHGLPAEEAKELLSQVPAAELRSVTENFQPRKSWRRSPLEALRTYLWRYTDWEAWGRCWWKKQQKRRSWGWQTDDEWEEPAAVVAPNSPTEPPRTKEVEAKPSAAGVGDAAAEASQEMGRSLANGWRRKISKQSGMRDLLHEETSRSHFVVDLLQGKVPVTVELAAALGGVTQREAEEEAKLMAIVAEASEKDTTDKKRN